MIIALHRDIFTDNATLGVLTVDGKTFGFTCEDEPRAVKVAGETCIPVGRYRVKRTWSPKYGKLMPLVCDVPGFVGVRLHSGNDEADTAGCVLIGLTRDVATMTIGKSRAACTWLDAQIAKVEAAGGEVWLKITSSR